MISYNRGDANWTHVEDVEDPVELELPRGDRLFIALRTVVGSGGFVAGALLDDLPLDLRNGSVIDLVACKLPKAWAVGLTHVVS